MTTDKRSINRGRIVEVATLIALPVFMFLCAYYEIEQTALVTLLAAIFANIPFFINFEKSRPKPRHILPIVIMSALATVGRILFAPIPHVKPVSSIVIVTGIVFGRQSGYLTGALTALASNMFMGQGPWTPWQMFAWGLIGFLAGVMESVGLFRHRWVVYVYGFASGLLFGLIMDSWHIISFISPLTWTGAIAAYGAGFFFNLAHAIATVVFLVPILKPWTKKLTRIKLKFDLDHSVE
ncbi:MAG TPA: ECF transporter S component [Clostridiaceae bacterium]|nr:ECF transporter S component [Clostridiaceae bacterium]